MWTSLKTALFPDGGVFTTGPLPWILLVLSGAVLVTVLRRRLLRKRAKPHRQGAKADRDDAMRLLRIRFASGRLGQEEFDRLRRAIESSGNG